MKHSRGQPLLATFGVLPGAQLMHTICRFGSHQSNASNGAQFGVEMKELEPLEADHTKLKANFVGCEITRGGLRNQPLAAKWCPSCCKISQPSCTAAKIS
uniref:Uncharacterized protein n=1 Tax=Vitis vinifera TaxID=29760 RepID=A5AQ44_VITVI|nr:hypothetical protein VITISV_026248 [Vitis vinifera]